MVRLKTKQDLRAIYRSCQITARLLSALAERVKPGITTAALNDFAEDFITRAGGSPAFKGYQNFPAVLCTSLNEEIVHGLPNRERVLRDGDVLSIDTGAVVDGYYSDAAHTYFVGNGPVPEDIGLLLKATSQALTDGIRAARAGRKLNAVSEAIARQAVKNRLKVIRDLTGHGVGYSLHEPPTVYNYPVPAGEQIQLRNGMVLALEPMFSLGSEEIVLGGDGWTYSTADGSLSAHFEHTIVIWNGAAVVLTEEGDETARELFGHE